MNRWLLMMVSLFLSNMMVMPAFADETPKWEKVSHEDGVLVHQKEQPGSDLPAFRGRGVVKAGILEILAVLDDGDRAKEWMHRCVESVVVERSSDFERVTYNKTDAPWPVSDRDVVVRSKMTLNPKTKTVLIRFRAIKHKKYPASEDTVRMTELSGHFKLKVINEKKTIVEYMVKANPGGSIPTWLVSEVSEDIPLDTIRGLRRQVGKTRGTYEQFITRWDPVKGGKFPADFME